MRAPLVVLAGLALAAPLPGCAQESGVGSSAAAREAFLTADYEAAIDLYRELARDGDAEAVRGWATSLAGTGRYDEGLEALAEGEAAGAPAAELARVRGELLLARGRREEAEAALRASIDGGASDAALAELRLGELYYRSGRKDEALRIFDGFIDLYNGSSGLDAEHLTAVGVAIRHLGAGDSGLFQDAVRAFGEAIEADPGDPRPRIEQALLFLEKYDPREAGTILNEALPRAENHPRHLLARALRAKFEGSSEALELTRRALEKNPNLTEARTFLARLYLDLEDPDRAEEESRRALETNPNSLDAWTELAAVAHLRDDAAAFAEARDRVLSLDPAHARLYEALAEVAYRTHRYADAVEFAREAVRLDPTSWSGMAELGMNQLRTGRIDDARATLEAAFTGDPYNVWVKNTLDLLDELTRFDRTESPRFAFLTHPDETATLSVYAPALAEEAFDALRARYGYEPPTPISIEIYDRHADFSVRTVGLAGIGALGVSFGSVLAMDSPGAMPSGSFNWGATLWHEISHAFTLGYTGHRVPRWLSEGLAVLDERHAREGWGSDVDPSFLVAFRDERLPPLERFNYGFVRPSYPGQVQHSYFLASLLCEMIEQEDGWDAVLRLLDAYRDGAETDEAFRRALSADLDEIDDRLRSFVERRYGAALAALGGMDEGPPEPGTFGAYIVEAQGHRAAGRTEQAIAALESARAIFPEYAGGDAPALVLGAMYEEAGDLEAAAAAYRDYTSRNENHFQARVALADVEGRLGHPDRAREALEEAVWIDPFQASLHEGLAAAYEEAGAWALAARERRAILGLEPADLAQAYYRLALALHRGGDPEARSTLLRALEIAPNYEAAQDLLLEMTGGGVRR